jgi:uncharacterized protein (DUF2461 family)
MSKRLDLLSIAAERRPMKCSTCANTKLRALVAGWVERMVREPKKFRHVSQRDLIVLVERAGFPVSPTTLQGHLRRTACGDLWGRVERSRA